MSPLSNPAPPLMDSYSRARISGFSPKGFCFAITCCLVLLLNSCVLNSDKDTIKGNREYRTLTRSLTPFTKVEVKGDFDVQLSQSSEPSVVIDADANLHNYIYTEVDSGTLIISQPVNHVFSSMRSISIQINCQTIDQIRLMGDIGLETIDTLRFDHLTLEILGASKAKLLLSGRSFTGNFPGSSNIRIIGNSDSAKFSFPGATNTDASKFKVRTMDVSLSGAGKVDVYASEKLEVNIAGAGMVNYYGNPVKVHSNIGGIGSLNHQIP